MHSPDHSGVRKSPVIKGIGMEVPLRCSPWKAQGGFVDTIRHVRYAFSIRITSFIDKGTVPYG